MWRDAYKEVAISLITVTALMASFVTSGIFTDPGLLREGVAQGMFTATCLFLSSLFMCLLGLYIVTFQPRNIWSYHENEIRKQRRTPTLRENAYKWISIIFDSALPGIISLTLLITGVIVLLTQVFCKQFNESISNCNAGSWVIVGAFLFTVVLASLDFLTKVSYDTKLEIQHAPKETKDLPNIPLNARWKQNGVTIAGNQIQGSGSNQLSYPCSFYVNHDQTVYVADCLNHRIVAAKPGATSSQVVAGESGQENRNDQLNFPIDVIVDNETDDLIICDYGNRRVLRWPLQSGTSVKTIIEDIDCSGLAIDDQRFLYVSDSTKHEVRRYRVGDTNGTVVAGGNGEGNALSQLNNPHNIFVDRDYSVYVSDQNNHRVVQWLKGAKEGIVVAGDRGQGNDLTQLNQPQGVFVDLLGTVYVADWENHRVVRWRNGTKQGNIIVGGNSQGKHANQLDSPTGLSFDRHGNLYVVDQRNHRVQIFWCESQCDDLDSDLA